jgi:hypothetical protein
MSNVVRYSNRRLTAEQKALMLSYAELDKDIDGTISGLTQTKSGSIDCRLCVVCFPTCHYIVKVTV